MNKTTVKHSMEGALDKTQIALRIPMELKYKVLQRYGKDGKTNAEAFIAALDASVSGVRLTKASLDAARAEVKANFEKRMAGRARRGTPPRATVKDYSALMK